MNVLGFVISDEGSNAFSATFTRSDMDQCEGSDRISELFIRPQLSCYCNARTC